MLKSKVSSRILIVCKAKPAAKYIHASQPKHKPNIEGSLKIAIPEYSDVQTGPKAQFGGRQDGFSKSLNHVLTLFLVIIPPNEPPMDGNNTKPAILSIDSILIVLECKYHRRI